LTGTQLYRKLRREGLFWSYNRNIEYIGDELLIEHTLLYAEIDDMSKLFELFDFETIKSVWNKRIVPDERHYGLNYYLAMIWFDISNPVDYLKTNMVKYSRYERIKNAQ